MVHLGIPLLPNYTNTRGDEQAHVGGQSPVTALPGGTPPPPSNTVLRVLGMGSLLKFDADSNRPRLGSPSTVSSSTFAAMSTDFLWWWNRRQMRRESTCRGNNNSSMVTLFILYAHSDACCSSCVGFPTTPRRRSVVQTHFHRPSHTIPYMCR